MQHDHTDSIIACAQFRLKAQNPHECLDQQTKGKADVVCSLSQSQGAKRVSLYERARLWPLILHNLCTCSFSIV